MAYCLDDGKIDQESEFETELYNSLLKQLEEMKSDISDETLALIWLYLHTIGKPVEPFLMHKDLWNFGKEGFTRSIQTLTWDQSINNDAVTLNHLALKDLIVNRLNYHDQCVKQWTSAIFTDALKDFCSKCQFRNCRNCAESFYMTIESPENSKHPSSKHPLSGNYTFHSIEKGGHFPTYKFIQESSVPEMRRYLKYADFFLQRKKGYWCIVKQRKVKQSRPFELYKISTTGTLYDISYISAIVYNLYTSFGL